MSNRVLITGGSRGIGAATVQWFYQNGWQIAFCYHKNIDAAQNIESEFPGVLAIQADIADEQQVLQMFEQIDHDFGGLEAIVCNAGVALPQQLLTDTDPEAMNHLFEVNVKGTIYCCREASKRMVKQHKGSIVTVSSVWGQVGGSCEAPYSATKGAIISFSKALSKELGPSGIRVNCVCPGVIRTQMNQHLNDADLSELADQIALMRLGEPSEVASAIGFLSTDAASYITGQVLSVDGGF